MSEQPDKKFNKDQAQSWLPRWLSNRTVPGDCKGALKKLLSLSNTQQESHGFLRVVSKCSNKLLTMILQIINTVLYHTW